MHASELVIDEATVVLSFNEAINRRDVAALAEPMTATHPFIDSAGAITQGKDACITARRGFFDSFPDDRNVFDDVAHPGDGIVVVRGHSECSFPALDGPAAWRAAVLGGQVDVWQVSEPIEGAH